MLFLTLILGSLLTAQTSTAEFINSIYYDQSETLSPFYLSSANMSFTGGM